MTCRTSVALLIKKILIHFLAIQFDLVFLEKPLSHACFLKGKFNRFLCKAADQYLDPAFFD